MPLNRIPSKNFVDELQVHSFPAISNKRVTDMASFFVHLSWFQLVHRIVQRRHGAIKRHRAYGNNVRYKTNFQAIVMLAFLFTFSPFLSADKKCLFLNNNEEVYTAAELLVALRDHEDCCFSPTVAYSENDTRRVQR